MTEVMKGPDGRTLSARGAATRTRLIEAAEAVFAELGYHEASIVKITEHAGVAQGTFYLYFTSKKEIFDELVRDLNGRVRHAMKEGSSQGANRLQAELLGFQAYFRFTSDHPALYRIIRQAEFVSRRCSTTTTSACPRATSRRCATPPPRARSAPSTRRSRPGR